MRCPKLVALVATAALGSCAFGDGSEPTKFERLPNNEFKFETAEDTEAATEEEAEAERIARLEQYLADHGLCPNGYVVKERFPIVAEDDPVGQAHNIVYRGACK
jgi:hypothetical protein